MIFWITYNIIMRNFGKKKKLLNAINQKIINFYINLAFLQLIFNIKIKIIIY